MNLIEQLGGYEKAKSELKDKKWRKDNLHGSAEFTWHMKQHIQLLESVLLEYRRQHNIFEVGDKVVWINSIAPSDSRLFEIEESLGEKPDTWSLRHATPEEIKAGKRFEVNQ